MPGATAGFDNDYAAQARRVPRVARRSRLLPAARRGDRRGRPPGRVRREGRRARALGRRRHRSARRRARRRGRAVPDPAAARPRDAVRDQDAHVGAGAVPAVRLDARAAPAASTPSPRPRGCAPVPGARADGAPASLRDRAERSRAGRRSASMTVRLLAPAPRWRCRVRAILRDPAPERVRLGRDRVPVRTLPTACRRIAASASRAATTAGTTVPTASGHMSRHDPTPVACDARVAPVGRSTRHMSDTFDRSQLDGKDREQLSRDRRRARREGDQPHAQGRPRRRDRRRGRERQRERPATRAKRPPKMRSTARGRATTSRRSPTRRTRSRRPSGAASTRWR